MRRLWLVVAMLLLGVTLHAQRLSLGLRTRTPAAPGVLTITTGDFTDCNEDIACGSIALQASGGGGGNEWSEVSGSAISDDAQCAGASLSTSTGVITRAMTTAGICTFTVRVTDDLAATDDQIVSFTVNETDVPLTAPLVFTDIGDVGIAGTAVEDTGEFTLTCSGANIAGTSDEGCFAYQPATNDAEQIVCPTSFTSAQAGSKNGAMLRASLAVDAAYFYVFQRPSAGAILIGYRETTGATAIQVNGNASGALCLRALRVSNTFTAYHGPDSDGPWTLMTTVTTITMPASYFAGQAVTAVNDTITAVAVNEPVVFDDTPDTGVTVDFGGYRPYYQGFGTQTQGGRGGTVIKVQNLNDSGTGSLRAALTATGARFVVCEISGTISLQSQIDIDDPFITVAMQTCPSPGLFVANNRIRVNTHDVVLQHFTVARGDAIGGSGASLWIRDDAFNIVLDHMAVIWGTDESLTLNASAGPEPQDIAVLNTIIAETFDNPDGGVVNHSRNISNSTSPNGTITYARNLIMNADYRCPEVHSGWRFMFVNNLTYNCRGAGGGDAKAALYQCNPDNDWGGSPMEVVHQRNVTLPGPDTPASDETIKIQIVNGCTFATTMRFYFEGNEGVNITGATGDGQWAGITLAGVAVRGSIDYVTEPAWMTTFNMDLLASSEVEDHVVANVGPWPDDRHALLTRLTGHVTAGTGQIIDTLDCANNAGTLGTPAHACVDVPEGGFPSLAQNTRTFTVVANPNTVADEVGRTNIEVQLEGCAVFVEDGTGSCNHEGT